MSVWRRLVETFRLMVGVPDYERYVAHRRERHPGEPVLSREAFVEQRQRARFGAADSPPRCC